MRRIISLLAAMALMATMFAASAMPAFADKGGDRGHEFYNYFGSCSDPCGEGSTIAYGGKEAGKGGLSSYDAVLTFYPVYYEDENGTMQEALYGTTSSSTVNERGGSGSKGGGSGGNCTTTTDYPTSTRSTEGNGSAC